MIGKMQVVTLIAAVLSVDAARFAQQPAGLSADCNEQLNKLKDPETQKASAECEQEGKYPDQVVALLKKQDEAGATKKVEEMFQKCAKFSETCAKQVAPGLVMELRFSGAAVSQDCVDAVGKVQSDPEAQKVAAKCQAEEKVGENILMALNKNDLKGAMGVADNSLQKCLKLSKGCAWQLSPVLVNDVVMQAMQAQAAQQQQPQTQQTIVLSAGKAGSAVSPMVLKLALQSKGKVASLLNMAVPKVALPTGKNLRAPVLLQTSSKVWVSKLLLTLARKQL